jgi:hypothetical protein
LPGAPGLRCLDLSKNNLTSSATSFAATDALAQLLKEQSSWIEQVVAQEDDSHKAFSCAAKKIHTHHASQQEEDSRKAFPAANDCSGICDDGLNLLNQSLCEILQLQLY